MMRRLSMVAASAALVLVLAVPAEATELTVVRSKGASANAFWYYRTRLGPGLFRLKTWYVGVFQSSDGTWTDLYEEVSRCRRRSGRVRCRLVRYRVGVTDLSAEGDSFVVNGRLSSADLVGTYPLQKYDSDWNEVGDPVDTVIAAHFEGVGELNRNRFSESWESGCSRFRYSSRGMSRQAEATGTIDGSFDLGATPDAWMSTNVSIYYDRTCGDPGEEPTPEPAP